MKRDPQARSDQERLPPLAISKTNAARILDRLGIAYELREYEVDLDDLAAESVARKLGMPAEQVFKTLVARGDRQGVCLAVIPGDAQLDLKALAAASAVPVGPSWTCSHCGEVLEPQFTQCWRCGAAAAANREQSP